MTGKSIEGGVMEFVSVYHMMKAGAGGGNRYTMNIFGRSVLTPLHRSLILVLFESLEEMKVQCKN